MVLLRSARLPHLWLDLPGGEPLNRGVSVPWREVRVSLNHAEGLPSAQKTPRFPDCASFIRASLCDGVSSQRGRNLEPQFPMPSPAAPTLPPWGSWSRPRPGGASRTIRPPSEQAHGGCSRAAPAIHVDGPPYSKCMRIWIQCQALLDPRSCWARSISRRSAAGSVLGCRSGRGRGRRFTAQPYCSGRIAASSRIMFPCDGSFPYRVWARWTLQSCLAVTAASRKAGSARSHSPTVLRATCARRQP
jgi:hypothetical protein